MTIDENDLTKLSFNAVPLAMKSLDLAATESGLSRTDTLNRAIQLYALLMTLGFWRAAWVLLQERDNVRRFKRTEAKP